MTTPFRIATLTAPDAPPAPKVPRFWRLRVWWASRWVRDEAGEKWRVHFTKSDGEQDSYVLAWTEVEGFADAWENVPAGEPLAIRWSVEGEAPVVPKVMFADPACVPTMARLARTAADAWARLPKSGAK